MSQANPSRVLPGRATQRQLGLGILLVALAATSLGGCASSSYLSVRRVPRNPLAESLQLLSSGGPQPSPRTAYVLRRYDLEKLQSGQPEVVLTRLQELLNTEGDAEKTYAFAELAYIRGKRAQASGDTSAALNLHSAAVAHAYMFLFAPQLDGSRNPYDPLFRQACDLYNAALEDVLRIINKQGRLQPGGTYTIEAGDQRFDVRIVTRGLWRQSELGRFQFVSDYEVKGLTKRHVTYGLGVPLIAERRQGAEPEQEPAAAFYPRGLSFPVTAVLHAAAEPCARAGSQRVVTCTLELCDPVAIDQLQLAGRLVPLQTDLTTPLGYFLDSPEFAEQDVATVGLLKPSNVVKLRGIYMLEAFDPTKIPLLMVHGLWSSPETWTEMINDLRSLPEIRNRYQFWTYLYATGQPFWVSATQLRQDLQRVRSTVDPEHRWRALDEMVLIGHSMGGLVSRLQTLESGEDYWQILSERPFSEMHADPETRERLARTVFFHPNPAIRRVITIGTPHHGSTLANGFARWLGRKVITLPTRFVQARTELANENPGFFRNTELLTVTTSIDSLSPKSPVLSVMLQSPKAPWTKYHNVVGVVSKRDLLGKITQEGDGIVARESAHLPDAQSEVAVEADHLHVHQHPLCVLEVRRILLEHSQEMYAEASQRVSIPAAYELPPRSPSAPSEPAAARGQ
jgi:pimeloyl-ACP methyl ester carboxylesterase